MRSAKVNCWEAKRCGREVGGAQAAELGPCPAATDITCDGINGGTCAGRICWAVTDTPCGQGSEGSYSQKAARCRDCSFFRRVMFEEGCHLQLLKPALGTADPKALHRRLNDVSVLLTLYRDIFASLAMRPLLELITQRAVDLTHSSAAGTYLLGESADVLCLAAAAGEMRLPESLSLHDDSPAASAVQSRRLCRGPAVLEDGPEDISMIAVPIGGERGTAGVMVVAGGDTGFTTDDEWFLRELALTAALGIGNSGLIGSLRDLREVDKIKSRHMSLLLHEIGSPLATVACSLRALLDVGDDLSAEDRRTLLTCSLDRISTISTLSRGLLDLGAIRAGGHLAETAPVCVLEALREEVDARRMQARQAGLDIVLYDRDEQAFIRANRGGLRLIFGNLLDNAIKYSAGVGKWIGVSARQDGDYMKVCVCDEGIGIPADEQGKLFEELHRARNAATSGARGFGLGLAFAKELVNTYGGRIELESEVAKGTSVTVAFPLSGQAAATHEELEATHARDRRGESS